MADPVVIEDPSDTARRAFDRVDVTVPDATTRAIPPNEDPAETPQAPIRIDLFAPFRPARHGFADLDGRRCRSAAGARSAPP